MGTHKEQLTKGCIWANGQLQSLVQIATKLAKLRSKKWKANKLEIWVLLVVLQGKIRRRDVWNGILIFYHFRMFCCAFLPCFENNTEDTEHRCSNCDHLIGTACSDDILAGWFWEKNKSLYFLCSGNTFTNNNFFVSWCLSVFSFLFLRHFLKFHLEITHHRRIVYWIKFTCCITFKTCFFRAVIILNYNL